MRSLEFVPVDWRVTIGHYHPDMKEVLESESLAEVARRLERLGYELNLNHLRLVANGDYDGGQLALMVVCRHLIAEEGRRFPHAHEFYRTMVAIGTNQTVPPGEGEIRARGERGNYQSQGYSLRIAEALGIEHNTLRFLIAGLRVDGVYLALKDKKLETALFDCAAKHIDDNLRFPPSLRNQGVVTLFQESQTVFDWYRGMYDGINGRRIGAFLPYEIDYWAEFLDEVEEAGDRLMPFSSTVLRFYAGLEDKVDLIAKIRNETGIRLDVGVFPRTLALLSSDFPHHLMMAD